MVTSMSPTATAATTTFTLPQQQPQHMYTTYITPNHSNNNDAHTDYYPDTQVPSVYGVPAPFAPAPSVYTFNPQQQQQPLPTYTL